MVFRNQDAGESPGDLFTRWWNCRRGAVLPDFTGLFRAREFRAPRLLPRRAVFLAVGVAGCAAGLRAAAAGAARPRPLASSRAAQPSWPGCWTEKRPPQGPQTWEQRAGGASRTAARSRTDATGAVAARAAVRKPGRVAPGRAAARAELSEPLELGAAEPDGSSRGRRSRQARLGGEKALAGRGAQRRSGLGAGPAGAQRTQRLCAAKAPGVENRRTRATSHRMSDISWRWKSLQDLAVQRNLSRSVDRPRTAYVPIRRSRSTGVTQASTFGEHRGPLPAMVRPFSAASSERSAIDSALLGLADASSMFDPLRSSSCVPYSAR